jgi:hypothetical protein
VRSGSYVSIQAYLQPRTATTERLQALRLGLAKRTGLPTTLGYGPRFLHSTGQLHKGGPDEGVFIQIADRPAADVPASPGTQAFGDLIRAQGLGDIAALRQRGRPAMRIEIAGDADAGLAEIVALIGTQEAG